MDPDFNWKAFSDELQGESHRAAAIVGAAILDELLGELIGNYLVDDETERKRLLSPRDVMAPLSGFSSRITGAYMLGLIDEKALKELRRINKVRPRFAHEPEGMTFENALVVGQIENLETPDEITEVTARTLEIPMPEPDPRLRFIWAVTMMVRYIRSRIEIHEDERLDPAPAFWIELEGPKAESS